MSVYREVDHFLDRVKIRIVEVSEEPQDSGPENLLSVGTWYWIILEIQHHENKHENHLYSLNHVIKNEVPLGEGG